MAVSPNGGSSDLPEPYASEGGNALHAVMVLGVADPGKLTGLPPTDKFAVQYTLAHQIGPFLTVDRTQVGLPLIDSHLQ